jgi:hypothetical protein
VKRLKIVLEKDADGSIAYPDGSVTPLTMSNHPRLKPSPLRMMCRQAGIERDLFPRVYEQEDRGCIG